MATVLIALLAIVIVLIVLSVFGYIFNWNWTGLSPYISPPHPKDSDFQRGKTLWDWLNLLSVLAIPVVVGLGAVWFTTKFNEQQSLTEHEIALDIQRETALQSYIDKMSELILREKLSDLAEADEVQ